ncbi:MAG TPA: BsuPI-related putative proteinase inhibitor [Gemmatimonadaceae bacterium]|jgi:hypothetical protein
MWLRTLTLTAALAAGCASPSGTPANADMNATQPSDVVVRVAASQPTVGPAESVRITVTVTNTGDERRVIEATSSCFTDYELLDARGDVVTSSMQLCAAVMSRRELAPGGSFSETHVWTRGQRGMPEVPAGRYRLRGLLLARAGTVTSDAVALEVTPGG